MSSDEPIALGLAFVRRLASADPTVLADAMSVAAAHRALRAIG